MTSRAETLLSRAAAQNKHAVELAMIASPAVRIEPAVLRTLRLEFLPASDPSAEADLWMSPLVGVRSASAITLVPEVASVLRQRLSEDADQGRLRRIADRISELHAALSPLLRLEERLIRLCYEDASPVDAIDEEMAPLLRMIDGKPDKVAVFASWAVRAIPRLPEAARRSRALWALALAGSAQFGVQPLLEGDPPEGVAWLLPGLLSSDVPSAHVEIRRDESTLELYLPARGAREPVLRGMGEAVALEVPATNPVIVEVRDGREPIVAVALTPGTRRHLAVSISTLELRTLRGATFDLDFWPGPSEKTTLEAPTIHSTSEVFPATIYQDEPPSPQQPVLPAEDSIRVPGLYEYFTYPWPNKYARDLHEHLVEAYPTMESLERIANAASVDLRHVEMGYGAVNSAWSSLLEVATNQGQLNRLIDAVLSDGNAGSHHARIREALANLGVK